MTGQKYGVYIEFKPSEDGWLGDIPAHWSANRLKFLASTFASNVDKKARDGELPVKLCNYTDVYYNDVVCSDLPFMEATATREQIEKFSLCAGDTIITKDSEDPNDIAVPTFVKQDLPGVICGYHLSMIRPTPIMSPGFLNKTFQCAFARAYFATRSNGLTRYGLGGQSLGDVVLPVPPLEEQAQIAEFLDYETAKIDALIEKQQRLIALLKEKRGAVISHAVTKGLNPDAPMRDSGVEWLGEVPAHWSVSAPKYFTSKIIDGPHHTPNYVDEGIPFVTVKNLTAGEWISLDDTKRISLADHREFIKRAHPQVGDVLITKDGTLGVTRVIETHEEFSIFVSVALVKLVRDLADPWFVRFAFESSAAWAQFSVMSAGAALKHIVLSTIANVKIPLPPLAEQREIGPAVRDQCNKIDELVATSERRVELLQERRTALISAAVTGKIDVRGWTPPASNAGAEVA